MTTLEQTAASDFAHFVKGLGFKVYLAERKTYGFITDEAEKRVLSFSFAGLTASLSGNYGPPSTSSGTGWKMDKTPYDLKTAQDVRDALYSGPGFPTGGGWKHYTTVKQHLDQYGSSSRYKEVHEPHYIGQQNPKDEDYDTGFMKWGDRG